jgi:polyhydroxyalkanoate synthesis regulator phasin
MSDNIALDKIAALDRRFSALEHEAQRRHNELNNRITALEASVLALRDENKESFYQSKARDDLKGLGSKLERLESVITEGVGLANQRVDELNSTVVSLRRRVNELQQANSGDNQITIGVRALARLLEEMGE